MEGVSGQVERLEFRLGHLAAGRVGIRIEFGVDLQAGLGRGSGDQGDDDLQSDQRMTAPVLRGYPERNDLFSGCHGHGFAWQCFCHSKDTATQSRDRGTQSHRFDQDAANAISG